MLCTTLFVHCNCCVMLGFLEVLFCLLHLLGWLGFTLLCMALCVPCNCCVMLGFMGVVLCCVGWVGLDSPCFAWLCVF